MSTRVESRRSQMRDEIVDTALDVMAGSGAAGLSLGEIAKRMGLRTPSLYGYFDSKAALCDEIFRRGWLAFADATSGLMPQRGTDFTVVLEQALERCVRWATDHPAYAQLMFWRPILNWQPSAAAFAPAVAAMERLHAALEQAKSLGQLDSRADVDEAAQVWAALVTGVISQQLSNEPGVAAAQGRTSRHTASMARMFAAHYAPRRKR